MRNSTQKATSVGRQPLFRQLQVVFLDVDGVFTDGKTWQDATGQWRRTFSVRDTMGIRALRKSGLRVVVLTPALSTEIRAHFDYVGVDVYKDHCLDTDAAIEHVLKAYGLKRENAAFIRESNNGSVSLSLGDQAAYVSARHGGDGAVLEISTLILQHAGAEQPKSISFNPRQYP